MAAVSIILPAKNEGDNLVRLLPALRAAQPEAEIIVVDDGSTDNTVALCQENGVRCVSHPYSMGNGAAVKTGVIFKDAKNKPAAKKFVAFLLEEANLTPYVEGSLGRWFPVQKAVVRTVMTLTASLDCTVAKALPA